ncbi:MAG: hypothetical protein ACRERV_00895 [Methylococcales bacterium]
MKFNISNQKAKVKIMTKERKSNKENKKKPTMTPKEKKIAKKTKKASNRPFSDA